MKRIKLGVAIVLSSLLFLGCSNKKPEENSKESSDTKKTEVTVETSSSSKNYGESYSSTFLNGKFSSNAYDLSIDKAETGHDNLSDYDVLVITFTVKNKTDENLVPKILFQDLFTIKQQDDTSEHELFAQMVTQNAAEILFSLYSIDGGLLDDETEKINTEKQKEFESTTGSKLESALLPGKEVQTVILIPLKNTEFPVTFSLDENLPMKEKEEFVVDLK